MGFKDRFRKKSNEPTGGQASAPAPDAPDAPVDSVQPVFEVSMVELTYRRMVAASNQNMADLVHAGQAGDMSPEMQAWFVEHAGKPVNPTEAFGVTWYLHQDPGNVQLVQQEMLLATGMDDPANMPGMTIWAMGTDDDLSEEAKTRKARSIATLAARQVNTNDGLPVIEDSTTAVLRTADEIADRAVCLMAVALKAEVFNEGDIVEWHPVLLDIIESFGLDGVLSPKERAFVDDMAPDQHTAIQFIWRYEGLAVLLWALGHLDSLDYPAGICDVPKVVSIIKELGPEGLKTGAQLRPVEQILDEIDFIYRLSWAVVEQRLGRGTVPGTEAGAVVERHHALNWLLASRNEDWDHVSTDT